MRIWFADPSVFEDESADDDLGQVLEAVRVTRHTARWADPGAFRASGFWGRWVEPNRRLREALEAELRPERADPMARPGLPPVLPYVTVCSAAMKRERPDVGVLTPREAVRWASAALRVWMENHLDTALLAKAIRAFEPRRLTIGLERGWLRAEGAGGLPNLGNLPVAPLRHRDETIAAIIDRDAPPRAIRAPSRRRVRSPARGGRWRYPAQAPRVRKAHSGLGQRSRDCVAAWRKAGAAVSDATPCVRRPEWLAIHVLRKRALENYATLAQLRRFEGDGNLRDDVAAMLGMSAKQRDAYTPAAKRAFAKVLDATWNGPDDDFRAHVGDEFTRFVFPMLEHLL